MYAPRLTWHRDGLHFEAVLANPPELAQHAEKLRDWYNAPANVAMMGGSGTMTVKDVTDFWHELFAAGGRGFLNFVDGQLVGDMDLRGVTASHAEFAIMIGDVESQGRGLGRTFAAMMHVHAFRDLHFERLFVPPRRSNERVHRLNDWLGYHLDESERASRFADEPDCVVSSLDAETFRHRHPATWAEVVTVPQ